MKREEWAKQKAERTMTVGQLRDKLAEFNQSMPVYGLWEGCWGIVQDGTRFGGGFSVEVNAAGQECLIIDVENY